MSFVRKKIVLLFDVTASKQPSLYIISLLSSRQIDSNVVDLFSDRTNLANFVLSILYTLNFDLRLGQRFRVCVENVGFTTVAVRWTTIWVGRTTAKVPCDLK